ncbi:MAG: hypothetical protein HYY40_02555 [Bacteroidetes bacterium]|nr:hypothetical protein [Bacteroidota bacterium]
MKISGLIFALQFLLSPVFSQDNINKWGADSQLCLRNLSLYGDRLKEKNFTEAYIYWKSAFEICPRASKKAYVDGIKIVEYLLKNEKNAARKEMLIDTLLLIYDNRIKYFGEEGLVLGKKGVDMYQYRKTKLEEINQVLQKSVELQGRKPEAGVLVAWIQTSAELVNAGKMTKEKLFEQYDLAGSVIDFNISANGEIRQYYESAKTNVDGIISPFADCKDIVAIYEPKVKQNPKDTLLLKKAAKMLTAKNCKSLPLFSEVSEALYALEPSAFAAFNLGQLFIEKGQHGKATTYLQQAADNEDDQSKKGEYFFELALHYFKNLGQNEQARNIARRTATFSSVSGKAYLLIGDIYISSAKSCFTDEFELLTVYWIAVDKYQQAKNAEGSVAEEANRKIATYQQYFPKKQDAFFRSLAEGQDYTVGCWMNETTKVRVQ